MSVIFSGIVACAPSSEMAVVETVAVETAVSPTTIASPSPVPTKPTVTPMVTLTPTPVSSSTPEPSPVPDRLITAEPIFTGGDLQFVEWSPNGRYLAYYEYTDEQVAESPVEGLRGTYPGTFVFYDTQIGEKCTEYPLSGFFNYEGGGSGSQWRWLPDGRLLLNLPDGLLLTEAPCVAGENVAGQVDEGITSIGTISPDERWLILTGVQQYWLYDWTAGSAHPIADVVPDSFNNLAWSPDSQHISINLAGNYTGDRSPVGGSRVIEVATGDTIAQYDWEPANALDGTFGGPVWISNDEFVVTLSLDQGPFFMDINGEVRPLLPLFDDIFEPENYWPPVDVYAEVENGRYAILYGYEGEHSAAKLYTFSPEGEAIELFDEPSRSFRIFPDGALGYEENGRYWLRPVFESDAPYSEQLPGLNPWLPTSDKFFVSTDSGVILVYDRTSGALLESLQVAGYEDGYLLYPLLAPDGQWLAIFVNEPKYSLGRALFVVPASQDYEESG